jgi:hypothetical protein
MYGLTLAKDNRIEAVGIYHQGFPDDVIVVDVLPEGDISEYRYIDGEYIHDPLPKPEQPEPAEEASVWDELDAAYQEGVNSV